MTTKPTTPVSAVRWSWFLVIGGLLSYVLLLESSLAVARAGPRPDLGSGPGVRPSQVIWVYPGTEIWAAGIRPGDLVREFPSGDWPDAGAQALVTEDPLSGEPRTVMWDSVDLDRLTTSLTLLSLSFLVIGTIVLLLADGVRTARALYLLCLSGAFALLAAVPTFYDREWAYAVEWFSLATVACTVPYFFSLFPLPVPAAEAAARRVFLIFGVPAVALSVAYVWVVNWLPDAYPTLRLGLHILLAAAFLASFGLVLRRWQRTRDPASRGQIRSVAAGIVIGLTPFLLLSLLPSIVLHSYLARPEVTIVAIAAFPAGLGYALLRDRLLGIDHLLRRSLLGAFIWLIILALAAGAVTILRPAITHDFEPSPISTAVVIFLAVTSIPWLVHRIQSLADRYIFRDIYDYPEALLDLTGALVRTRDWNDLRRDTLEPLRRLLNAQSVSVVVDAPSGVGLAAIGSRTAVSVGAPDLTRPDAFPAPAGGAARPLHSGGLPIGTLVLAPKQNGEPYLASDLQLVETLAASLGVTIENLRLVESLQQHINELEEAGDRLRENQGTIQRLYERVTEAQEEERRRIARDIHDEPLQKILLLMSRPAATREAPAREAEITLLGDIATTLRTICSSLRPPVLDELGLAGALDWLVDDLSRISDAELTFIAEPDVQGIAESLPDDVAMALFRVTQEALSNALKHAAATRIEVSLTCLGDGLEIIISDNGRGFAARPTNGERPAAGASGLGHIGMRERLRPIGGHLEVVSHPGHGAQVFVRVEEVARLGRADATPASV